MGRAEELKRLLVGEFGITNVKELDRAVREMTKTDIGVFVSVIEKEEPRCQ